jgi:uncharacterized PurR-regulated membrane protein YhhQ (DUF165 family)
MKTIVLIILIALFIPINYLIIRKPLLVKNKSPREIWGLSILVGVILFIFLFLTENIEFFN